MYLFQALFPAYACHAGTNISEVAIVAPSCGKESLMLSCVVGYKESYIITEVEKVIAAKKGSVLSHANP